MGEVGTLVVWAKQLGRPHVGWLGAINTTLEVLVDLAGNCVLLHGDVIWTVPVRNFLEISFTEAPCEIRIPFSN
jgi:hypothetical protein